MHRTLALSFRFLNGEFHGRGDRDGPEWPPSPHRVFQSLVAAAARSPGGVQSERGALAWMEGLPAPVILAPRCVRSGPFCLSVPNNSMDIVAKSWQRNPNASADSSNPAKQRTMKMVRSLRMIGGIDVHYLWMLPESSDTRPDDAAPSLCALARCVTVIGWGIDLVAGNGVIMDEQQATEIVGERWIPGDGTNGRPLRVPTAGALDELLQRHERFLRRIGPDGTFRPPPPLTRFRMVAYRRDHDAASRPYAAFAIRDLEDRRFRAFNTVSRALTVSGMVRHAADAAARAARKPASWIGAVVLGHGEAPESDRHIPVGPARLAYLAVPSIESRGRSAPVVGAVRRVLVASPTCEAAGAVAWARRTLAARELQDERSGDAVALLGSIPDPVRDRVLARYLSPAVQWATVTPVVLPGFDDPSHYRRRLRRGVVAAEQHVLLARLDARIEALLRKAVVQAGFPDALARYAEIAWCKTGFWPGTELADRYGVPDHLRRYPRYHVRIRWRDARASPVAVAGPVCIGGGRFAGLGLMAAMEDR